MDSSFITEIYCNIQIAMSYQKKSLILIELEQAIRKKAQEKSKNKDQVNRVLQSSIQKKKNIVKTTTNKDQQVSIHKNSSATTKQYYNNDKPVSLFNNEQLNTLQSGDFKAKKYNNRRLDKLMSLIQYMISSSEKALKYINSTNFEAEFALKLYRSDKDNLVNEIKNLNFEDILESQRSYEKSQSSKSEVNIALMVQQNNRLKKSILILEKEAERYHRSSSPNLQSCEDILQKQNSKFRQMLRKLIPFDAFKSIIELLQKQNKFEAMSLKCEESNKKIAEIQIIINSLQNQRMAIIDSLSKAKTQFKSDRTFKISEIQLQKQELQRELNSMKAKLSEIIQSSRSLSELELIKKNNQLINQKLMSLVRELSENSLNGAKKTNEQLIDWIKNFSIRLVNKMNDVSLRCETLQNQAEELNKEIFLLRGQNKQNENEFEQSEQKMKSMFIQIKRFKGIIEQFEEERQYTTQRIKTLENTLRAKEQQVESCFARLKQVHHLEASLSDLKQKNNQLRHQMAEQSKHHSEKYKMYKQNIDKLNKIKENLQQKALQLTEQLDHQRNEHEQLSKRNEQRQNSHGLLMERLRCSMKEREQDFVTMIRSLELQLQQKASRAQMLLEQNDQACQLRENISSQLQLKNELVVSLQQSIIGHKAKELSLKQEINHVLSQLEEKKAELFQQQNYKNELKSELEKINKQNVRLSEKLSMMENQINKEDKAQPHLTKIDYQKLLLESQQNQQRLAKELKAGEQLLLRNVQLKTQLEDKDSQIKQLKQAHQIAIKRVQSAAQERYNKTIRQSKLISEELQFLKEERSAQNKIISQQIERFKSQVLELSRQLNEEEMAKAKMTEEKEKIRDQLELNQENIQSLTRKIKLLQEENADLQTEIQSLSTQATDLKTQNEQSKNLLHNLEQQNENLQAELQSTKQRIEEHSEIGHSKNQQYANLLKQILKGISIDSQEYASLASFEELLEYGSEQVVRMRKRQRQQESNKRKNFKRSYNEQEQILQNEFESNQNINLELCKAQLFHEEGKGLSKSSQVKEGLVELDQFGELKQGMDNSIVSQQIQSEQSEPKFSPRNQFFENISQFNNVQDEQLNDSLISNPDDIYPDDIIPNKLSLESKRIEINPHKQSLNSENVVHSIDEPKLYPQYEQIQEKEIDQFNQIDLGQMAHSTITVKSKNAEQDSCNANELALKQRDGIVDSKANDDANPSQYYVESEVQPYKLPSSSQEQQHQHQHLELSHRLIISNINKFNSENNLQGVHIIQNRDIGLEQDTINIKSQTIIDKNHNVKVDLDEFNNFDDIQLNQSIISQNNNEKQAGNELSSIPLSALNQSKISKHSVGIEEFGNLQNMNQSLISENQKGIDLNLGSQEQEQTIVKAHDIFDFSQVKSNPMNDSIISAKQKECGMSEFDQISENKMNDSLLSENQKAKSNDHSKDLDQFEQYASIANDSIISSREQSKINEPNKQDLSLQ